MNGARAVLLALAAAALTGCQRHPLEQKISVRDMGAYNLWVGSASRDLSPAQAADLAEARGAIRLSLMAGGKLSGAETVDAAFLEKINGLTARELLRLGLEVRQRRFADEKAELEQNILYQSKLKTKPGDKESADYLQYHIALDRERLAKVESELAAIQAKMAALAVAR